ncbi:MAG: dihydropteroate synthase [Prevotella sp.]|nr:dihydropteroate synthase [Prevotella sp.]
MNYTLNIKGRLLDLNEPRVMGILNATPDSFYAGSRRQTEHDIAGRADEIVAQGGSFIDVGAYSTRPGAQEVSVQEEISRLRMALGVVRRVQPDIPLSVDTFRADVARMAVEEYGADIINDVSEGADAEMFRMVSRLRVPYILMSVQKDLRHTLMAFAQKVQMLRDMGQKDIILDPGFGFGKTLDDNYRLMNALDRLQVMQLPVLVGVSRKSMIYKLLATTQEKALNGTTVLNTVALMKGASILRVHDVKEAIETIRIYDRIRN